MLRILRDNRLENEKDFLSILLNNEEVFNTTQIEVKYLSNENNKKLLEYSKECFEEFGAVNICKIGEKHLDFDYEYFSDILDRFEYRRGWQDQLKISEESIVKSYKEDVIRYLNGKIIKKEMTYDEFMIKMKKLDEIQLISTTPTLTKQEIIDNINTQNSRLNFNNFDKMNKILQLVRGDFLIIGATTGAGKSGFMLNVMNDLMNSCQCIYFNMEMSKSTIYKRIVSIEANVQIDKLLNPESDYQKDIIEASMQKIEDKKLVVEHKVNDIRQIRATISKLKDKDRHTVLFIDHLGLCKADGTKNLYEQATEVAKNLRQICLEYDCTIISASQLNRSAYATHELTLSMLKDSGELENSASKVILLYPDNDYDGENPIAPMNIEVAKNRDGICGVIKMDYDKTKQIFRES